MKDDLERVLKGLGRVEAPVGLEGRVLRGLEARRQARRFELVWAWAVAAVLVGVLVSGFGGRKADNPPAHEAETMRHPGVVVGKGAAVEAGRAASQSSGSVGRRSATLAAQDDGGVVVAEGGYPSPVAPLSDQERLLLRLARRPNEATIAMFDEGIREERAAAEKAEFEMLNPQPPVTIDATEETKDDVPGKQ